MNRRVLILLFCLLAIANIAAATLLPAHWDWTRQHEFTLSPQTCAILGRLAKPASVLVLTATEPRTAAERGFEPARLMLRELLPLYSRTSSLVAFREFDPATDPEARRWQKRFPDAITPCVLVVSDSEQSSQHEVLSARDLIDLHGGHKGSITAVEFHGERVLTSAISRVGASQGQSVIYSVTGHDELDPADDDPDSRRGLGWLSRRLAEVSIDFQPLNLGTIERIPSDADCVLIAGPRRPLDHEEVLKLRQYVARGGKALLLFDRLPISPQNQSGKTGLEDLLQEFGVTVGNDYVVTRGITGGAELASPALPANGAHPLVRTLSSSALTLYECRSVRALLGVNVPTTDVVPLLMSHPAPRAWAEGDPGATDEPQPGGPHDIAGPVAMAVAVEDVRGPTREPLLVVCGDAEFASNHALNAPEGQAGYHFLLSSLNWLRGRKSPLADIPPQRRAAYQLTGTLADQRGLVWKPALFLAALIITTGATVWTTRRVP